MVENIRELGHVKLVQLQPSGLIIQTPNGEYYDPSRRLVVDRLFVTPQGIEALTPSGERVLDIHHMAHPGKAYGNDDLVCIGFTSHYTAMRARFGEHMVEGIAGENIIIEYDREIWPEDLGQQIGIENQETGRMTVFNLVRYAAPCEEFSHFVAQSQDKRLPASRLKSTLQFLGNGRRGYLLVLKEGQEGVHVRPGDRVFVINQEY
jgi:MOSC domain-containing protein YiiM